MRNPLQSTGLVFRQEEARQVFVGTCFALLDPRHLVTAAHVVRDVPLDSIRVSVYNADGMEKRGLVVSECHVHPMADIAVLCLEQRSPIFDLFGGIDHPLGAGTDVVSFGYPEDSTDAGPRPIPRLFKAHVQRVFEHVSPLGYSYTAYELSMPAPAGLSGSPIGQSSRPQHVAGLVVENRESTLALSKITELQDNERTYREVVELLNVASAPDGAPAFVHSREDENGSNIKRVTNSPQPAGLT